MNLKLFESTLDQILAYDKPALLYTHHYGRFMFESTARLFVKKDDVLKEFDAHTQLEMDQRRNFTLLRKPFYSENEARVKVVGSQASFTESAAQPEKKTSLNPEFVSWVEVSIAEIFSAYEQTNFMDSSEKYETNDRTVCYKNASGHLCTDKAHSLPIEGKYKIMVSGDASGPENTTLEFEFKFLPHPRKDELLTWNEKAEPS